MNHLQREANRKATKGLKVGFYVCNDTIIRCSWVKRSDEKLPTTIHIVHCPVCHQAHRADTFMWRAAKSADEFMLAHVALSEPASIPPGDPPAPPLPKSPKPRQEP